MKSNKVANIANRRVFAWAQRVFLLATVTIGVGLVGCVSNNNTDFPNRLVGADGQLFTVEDLEEIANDPDLSEDEKREAFRELGIEDEELIDALLDL